MSSKKITIDKKSFTMLGGRIDTLLSVLDLTASGFAKSISITEAYLSRLMRIKGKGGDKLWRGIRREYPQWEAFLRCEVDQPPARSYVQHPEQILPRKEQEAADSGPGQMKLPEFEKYRVVQVITPDEKWELLNLKLDKIMDKLEAIEMKLKHKA